VQQHTSRNLTKARCEELLDHFPFMDISSKISDLVTIVLTCSSEQRQLSEQGIEAIQAVKDTLPPMEEKLRSITAADDPTAPSLRRGAVDQTVTHGKLLKVSHDVQGLGSKIDQLEIAFFALRIGLEGQLESIARSTSELINASAPLSLTSSLASTLFTCLAAGVTTTIVANHLGRTSRTAKIVGKDFISEVNIISKEEDTIIKCLEDRFEQAWNKAPPPNPSKSKGGGSGGDGKFSQPQVGRFLHDTQSSPVSSPRSPIVTYVENTNHQEPWTPLFTTDSAHLRCVPPVGIRNDVIQADIQRYLGPDALVGIDKV
jgi:hypothetical protein